VLHVEGPALAGPAKGAPSRLEIRGEANASGRVLDTVRLETTVDLARVDASIRQQGFRLLTSFAVEPGTIELQFSARLGPSGARGSIRSLLDVPAFVDGEYAVSPPLLTLPVTAKLVAGPRSEKSPPMEIPFRLGAQPFLPDASPVLESGVPRELCVFIWPGNGPILQVAGELAQPGRPPRVLEVRGEPRVVRDADGVDRYVVTVVPPRAPPGSHTVRLIFRDPITGRTARSETDLRLQE
jgi:hypothetical protein